jgi:anti-sigma regulatory factor (Ser/Thr protein kinase)
VVLMGKTEIPVSQHFRIRESSQCGEARRAAAARARQLGFDEEQAGRVAVVASELSWNLVKHAPLGGDLFVGTVERAGARAVELIAVDRGPGLPDKQDALRDGYSTAGSSGTGLGAVSRLSDAVDFHSAPGRGTVVVSRIWRDAAPLDHAVTVGGVCAAKEGEDAGGDAFAVVYRDGQARAVVADGLGHGPGAASAAVEAVRVFRRTQGASVAEVLEAMHRALRSTRGAAVALAEIDPAQRSVRYAGLGNLSGVILGPEGTRNLVSHNGTVGHSIRRIQEFSYELPPNALLVIHSDGLKSRWTLDGYPGLTQRDPSVVAAVLFRDYERSSDDATVVVARVP